MLKRIEVGRVRDYLERGDGGAVQNLMVGVGPTDQKTPLGDFVQRGAGRRETRFRQYGKSGANTDSGDRRRCRHSDQTT
jgi:hypothetical protein